MKTLIFAILFAVYSSIASETNNFTPAETVLKNATDKFMAGIIQTKPNRDLIEKYWAFPDGASDKAEETISRFKSVLIGLASTGGKPLKDGYEFLGIRRIGSDTVRLVYVQKFEHGTLGWVFIFYRTNDEYKLVDYAWGKDSSGDINAFTVNIPANRQN